MDLGIASANGLVGAFRRCTIRYNPQPARGVAPRSGRMTSAASTASILWPMLAHIGWVCLLYAWLTVARARAVLRHEVTYQAFEFGRDEPPAVARITRNLANQFEWPV